jgi:PQQ-dependent catabolism-associated CXXCW motif protein
VRWGWRGADVGAGGESRQPHLTPLRPNGAERRASIAGLALLAMLFAASAESADAPAPEPDGFRMEAYDSPPPATVRGRLPIETATAKQAWERREAVFIDVLPAPHRPEGLPASAIWAPQPRLDIPGSIWLPDVGRGALSAEREAWFRTQLARISGGNRAVALILYCKASCWMSWNAAKRALDWGYVNARWYRDGSDGWQAAGLPLEKARLPEDRPN